MVERPPASAPGATRLARQGALPSGETDQHTARIPLQPGRGVPGWLWGMLGCLTVLGVGFAVLFVVMKPGAEPTAAGSAALAAPASPSLAVPGRAT